MTSNLSRALCVVGLSAALTAAAGGPAFAQGAERQILLGAVVPSSGPFAEWGRANTVTLQMLEQQINDAGGINGAKLHISILDDATKPAQATNDLRGCGAPHQQRGGGRVSRRQRDEVRLDITGFLETGCSQAQPALGLPQYDR
jgi:Periplasmic binding protein